MNQQQEKDQFGRPLGAGLIAQIRAYTARVYWGSVWPPFGGSVWPPLDTCSSRCTRGLP